MLLDELDHGEGVARLAKALVVDDGPLAPDVLDVAALLAHRQMTDAA
jgi:hypothetical protein